MALTRRQLVELAGRAGGFGAAYWAMETLGLIAAPEALAAAPRLGGGSGRGTSVVVLGAGLAGLTAAYELSKAGYTVRVLEAQGRAGGRCWTVRGGDRVAEIGGPAQTCSFDRGLYFNAGAARIPSHHAAVLGYCRDFGVPLEVFVNDNRGALVQSPGAFGGRPIEARRRAFDTRGHIAELLAKALRRGALDRELSAGDKARLSTFLRRYGDLDAAMAYRGSSRSGYRRAPGVAPGIKHRPLPLRALLAPSLWSGARFQEAITQQATMLQPVGGMDRIAAAFVKRVGRLVTYGAEVRQLRKTPRGVRIVARDRKTGRESTVEADYCICTIPLPVLARVRSDLAPAVKAAIRSVGYVDAAKLAWQAERRFWEADHAIYGGITYTGQASIGQIWYPCHDFHAAKGVLLGAYTFAGTASRFGRLRPDQRAALARRAGARIHPEIAREAGRPVSVVWSRVPFAEGGWGAWWGPRGARYRTLRRADGRIYLAGEHLSYLGAWQEGAIRSALDAVRRLHRRVQAGR